MGTVVCLMEFLGSWLSRMCGMEETLNTEKVKSHLLSVHRYNFKKDLTDHANPQRSPYALGKEGGLLLGSWPKGASCHYLLSIVMKSGQE